MREVSARPRGATRLVGFEHGGVYAIVQTVQTAHARCSHGFENPRVFSSLRRDACVDNHKPADSSRPEIGEGKKKESGERRVERGAARADKRGELEITTFTTTTTNHPPLNHHSNTTSVL